MNIIECVISIVIPTYNSEKTLKSCFNSIFQQTYQLFEVLVIDGGSQDNTLDLIDEYSCSHPNIRFISEPDKGVYDAMNKGIRISRGDWIIFMGSDDVFYLNTVLETLSSKIDPDLGFIYGNCKINGNARWAKEGDIYDGEFNEDKILTKNICHQAILYNKSVFHLYGLYSLDYPVLADWEFNLRIFNQVASKYVNIIVTEFHSGGISTSSTIHDDFTRQLAIITYRSYKKDLFSNYYSNKANRIIILFKYFFKRVHIVQCVITLCALIYHRLKNNR